MSWAGTWDSCTSVWCTSTKCKCQQGPKTTGKHSVNSAVMDNKIQLETSSREKDFECGCGEKGHNPSVKSLVPDVAGSRLNRKQKQVWNAECSLSAQWQVDNEKVQYFVTKMVKMSPVADWNQNTTVNCSCCLAYFLFKWYFPTVKLWVILCSVQAIA